MADQKKIVVVDDDVDFQNLMKERLSAKGYQVLSAVDGFTGLRLVQVELPDVVLLDLGLPAGDGFTVMKRLKSMKPLRGIPVITVSGRDANVNRDRAIECGSVAYLQKPFEHEELLETIYRVLDDKDSWAKVGIKPKAKPKSVSPEAAPAPSVPGEGREGVQKRHLRADREMSPLDLVHMAKYAIDNLVEHVGMNEEYTIPERILGPVRRYFLEMGYHHGIELDPASTESNPTKATQFFPDPEDGLVKPWSLNQDRPTHVFVKPPYGSAIEEWLAKLDKEAAEGNRIVALLPATRLERDFWHHHAFNDRLTALCLIRDAVSFTRMDGKEGQSYPSACILYIYNGRWATVAETFGEVGLCFPVLEMVGRPGKLERTT